MGISLEQFSQQVVESGLLSADDLQTAMAGARGEQPRDAEQFARLLVRQKLLTAFQAQQIYSGKGKTLNLGNYVILEKLGQGGMGMVLKAQHRRMDRIVALKVLSPAVVKTPDLLARFHREVKAAARLAHQNIVIAFDADEANGTHFLVMQYVEGDDLSSLVRKKGPLPVSQAVNCVLQIAQGLEYAHQHGVIHRDIKPANLLLDAQGTVKILDMGLARIEGETGAQAELTSTGAVMGTVDYMAPEQALSTRNADARSDIYSLGITLWYLLTGKPAYEGDSLMARLLAHRESPIPSLREVSPLVSPDLDAVFAKMIAKQPEDRYQSMTDVVAALRQCLDGTASAPSIISQPGEDSRFSAFLRGIDSSGGRTAVVPEKLKFSAPNGEQTLTLQSSQVESDPQTERTLMSELRARKRARSQSGAPWWRERNTWIAAGGSLVILGALVLLFSGRRESELDPQVTPSSHLPAADLPGPTSADRTLAATAPATTSIASHTVNSANGQIDLLSLVDMSRDAPADLKGKSIDRTSGFLWENMGPDTQISLPIVPQGDYRMHVELTRLNNDGSVNFVVPVADRRVKIIIMPGGGINARQNGVVDDRLGTLAIGRRYSVDIDVSSSGANGEVEVSVGDRSYLLWSGKLSDLRPFSEIPDSKTVRILRDDTPGFGAFSNSARIQFHAISLVMRSGQADLLRLPNSPKADTATQSISANAPRFIDLLPHVDLQRDIGAGNWKLVSDGVACENPAGANVLQLPYEPPEEYDFEIEFTPTGGEKNVNQYLAANGRMFTWKLNSHGVNPPLYGFELLDGKFAKDLKEAAIQIAEPIQDGRRYRSTVEVRRGSLRTLLDGKELVHWSGEFNRLSMENSTPMRYPGRLGIGSWRRSATFHAVRVREVSAPGRLLSGIPPPAVAPFDASQAKQHQQAWARFLGTQIETVNSIGMRMTLIPPGEFLMGCSEEEHAELAKTEPEGSRFPEIFRNERPQHRVRITRPFAIGTCEVTRGEFRQFVDATRYVTEAERAAAAGSEVKNPTGVWNGELGFSNSDRHPVIVVTWKDALAFCDWLSQKEGAKYTLPTEAQAEYVCRAGQQDLWAGSKESLSERAWLGPPSPRQVGLKQANPFGLFDVQGNVGEWCLDGFAPYGPGDATDPLIPSSGPYRHVRGGNFKTPASHLRPGKRGWIPPELHQGEIGFRVVRLFDEPVMPRAASQSMK